MAKKATKTNQQRQREKLYLSAYPQFQHNIPSEITNILNTSNLSSCEITIYNKIYAYQKNQRPPLTPQQLKKLIAFGKKFDFSEIGPDNQDKLLMSVANEVRNHPLIEKVFLDEYPQHTPLVPPKVLYSPDVTNHLKSIKASGSFDGSNIKLSNVSNAHIFLHETLHARQQHLNLAKFSIASNSTNSTQFAEFFGAEAEAIAYSNLIESRAELFTEIYNTLKKRYPRNKEKAEREFIGTVMELYLSSADNRQNVLKQHKISYTPQLLDSASVILNDWQQMYAQNHHIALNPNNNNYYSYNAARLTTLNNYYNKKYDCSNIDLTKAYKHIALSNIVAQMENNTLFQSKIENINSYIPNTELTLFHVAHLRGDKNTMYQLIKKGANVNIPTKYSKETPLHISIRQNDANMVAFLLNNGAQPNLKSKNAQTPLTKAVLYGNIEIASQLLAKGANPNLKSEGNNTPLISATLQNNPRMVSLLMDHNADPNILNKYGNNALHIAVDNQNTQIVSLLFKNNQKANAKYKLNPDTPNNNGSSPLLMATFFNNQKLATVLIQNGAHVNYKNKDGLTPLALAVNKGNKNMVAFLLKNGADAKTTYFQGESIERYARRTGQKEIANMLAQASKSSVKKGKSKKLTQESVSHSLEKTAQKVSLPSNSLQETLIGYGALTSQEFPESKENFSNTQRCSSQKNFS